MAPPNVIKISEIDVGQFDRWVIASSGCWNWSGSTRSDGYGRFRFRRDGKEVSIAAHRISFALAGGTLSDLPLDHLCRNRLCVRPDHLEEVTARVNVARASGQMSSVVVAWDAGYCGKGHCLADVGIYVSTNGRYCAECGRQRSRRYKARRLAAMSGVTS